METVAGDGSEAELMTRKKGKHSWMTSASLTLDYWDKEESNNIVEPFLVMSNQI